ncbi:hypothetical protein H1R20_g10068, partial [Candolleomyces eurysporus]
MTTPALQTFPPELLGELFFHCLPDDDPDRMSPQNAPLVFCTISSYWRQAALSEHRLWDTVIFPSPQANGPSITYDQAIRFIRAGGVERWFNRTGTERMLSFGEEGPPDHKSSLITFFLPIVTKYARRLRHLSLSLVKIRHFEFIRRGFPYDLFENLESVSICCTLEMTTAQLHAFERLNTPFHTKCPKLKHASFTLLRAHPMRFAMPWSQLTSIQVDSHLHPLTIAQWAQLFRECKNLRHATLAKPKEFGTGYGLWPIVELEHHALTSLHFWIHETVTTYWYDYCKWDFLHHPVRFPNLRHLKFDLKHGNAIASLRSLNPVTKSYLPKLEAIQITTPEDAPFHIPADVKGMVEQIGPLIEPRAPGPPLCTDD